MSRGKVNRKDVRYSCSPRRHVLDGFHLNGVERRVHGGQFGCEDVPVPAKPIVKEGVAMFVERGGKLIEKPEVQGSEAFFPEKSRSTEEPR